MVTIFRASNADTVKKQGYSSKYVADIVFKEPTTSGGFILVSIPPGEKTSPHAHELLEEVFVILNRIDMIVDGDMYELDEGDVVLISPKESHSFQSKSNEYGKMIAIKFPNAKTDKIILAS